MMLKIDSQGVILTNNNSNQSILNSSAIDPILIGFDTEYQSVESLEIFQQDYLKILQTETDLPKEELIEEYEKLPHGVNGERRLIVSFQISVGIGTKIISDSIFFRGIDRLKRPSFREILIPFLEEKVVPHLKDEGVHHLKNDPIKKRSTGKIYFACHYNRFDLSLFSDFRNMMDRGILTEVQKTLISTEKPLIIRAKGIRFQIYFRDTKTLSGGVSLEKMGEALGFKKLGDDLDKTKMLVAELQNHEKVKKYGIRDTEILVKWLRKVMGLIRTIEEKYHVKIGNSEIPTTLSSVLSKTNIKLFAETIKDLKKGRNKSSKTTWHDYFWKGKGSSVARELERCGDDLFRGGLNGSSIYGIVEGPLHDVDIKGAYPRFMKRMKLPDYHNAYKSTDLEEILEKAPRTYSFGKATWKYPKDEINPSVAISSDIGLVCPLEAENEVITGVELEELVASGAKVSLAGEWWIIPKFEEILPCQALLEAFTDLKENSKDVADKNMCKLTMNSLYGQIARGISKPKVFSWSEGDSVPLEPGPLTSPLLASYITAVVRGALAEMIRVSSQPVPVFTTDGMLSLDSPLVIVKKLIAHEARTPSWRELGGPEGALEAKTILKDVFVARTRMYFDSEYKMVRIPGLPKRDEPETKEIVQKMITRSFKRGQVNGISGLHDEITAESSQKHSLRDFWKEASADLGEISKGTIKLTLLPDFKRIPRIWRDNADFLTPPSTKEASMDLRNWIHPRAEDHTCSTQDLELRILLRESQKFSRIPHDLETYFINFVGDSIGSPGIETRAIARDILRKFEIPESLITKIMKRQNHDHKTTFLVDGIIRKIPRNSTCNRDLVKFVKFLKNNILFADIIAYLS